MRRLIGGALLGALLSLTCWAEPRPDRNTVTLPTFLFDQRHAITAGIAFVLEEGGKRYLTTAYHVLGPSGGLTNRISPREVPQEVKAIAGLCLGDSETVVLAQPALLIPDARSFDEKGADADVVFARVKTAGGPQGLKFSGVAAKQGDRIWMLARLLDRDRASLYPASVTDVSENILQYAFEDDALNLRALSGAPLLNAGGEVVGMHLAFGKKENALVGVAAPAAGLRTRLKAAAGEP
jgi:hypothetical protein